MVRKPLLQDEMASNPLSPYWDDIEANMTAAHRQQQAGAYTPQAATP